MRTKLYLLILYCSNLGTYFPMNVLPLNPLFHILLCQTTIFFVICGVLPPLVTSVLPSSNPSYTVQLKRNVFSSHVYKSNLLIKSIETCNNPILIDSIVI